MSCSTQSPTHARTCTRSTSSIFETWRGTRGLLLESTEAFYRTALRRGHCATQAHSGRSSLTPAYTPMGDNGKGGYILPKKKERENERKGGEKEAEKRRDRGSFLFIRPSVASPPLYPLLILTLPNPTSSLLSGGLRQTRSHTCTHYKHQQWHVRPLQVTTQTSWFFYLFFFKQRSLRGICRLQHTYMDLNTHSSRFTPLAWERVERLYVISTLCW